MTTKATSAAQLQTSKVYPITSGSDDVLPPSFSMKLTSFCSFAPSCAASAAVVISSTCRGRGAAGPRHSLSRTSQWR